jgi:hypothetical protein
MVLLNLAARKTILPALNGNLMGQAVDLFFSCKIAVALGFRLKNIR